MNQLRTMGRNDSSAVRMFRKETSRITSTKIEEIHTAMLKSS